MTRENLLFSIIGLLLGFIIGFMSASMVSQRQAVTGPMARNQSLPPDHPPIQTDDTTNPQQVFAEVQASISKARNEPNNFDAQLTAAELEYRVQRYDQAIEFLLKANQLRPADYQTIVLLGISNLDAGHFETAEKWYRAALQKKSDDVTVLAGLCAATLGKGDAKAAQEAIAKLENVDPNSQDLPQFRERLASLKSGR
jgi:tetratricopeptide (TPR) repeat protein